MKAKVTTWELAQGKADVRYLPHAETPQSQKTFLQNGAMHFYFLGILRAAYFQCGCEGVIALSTTLESARFPRDGLETIFFFFKKSTIQINWNYASHSTAMGTADVHRQALG